MTLTSGGLEVTQVSPASGRSSTKHVELFCETFAADCQMISDVSRALIVPGQCRGVTNLSNGAVKVENVEEWKQPQGNTLPSTASMVFSPPHLLAVVLSTCSTSR